MPALSGWLTLYFLIEASDLLPGDIDAIDAATTLADVGLLRIHHAVGDEFRADTFPGQLYFDNIEVPEPTLPIALAAGAATLWLLRSNRRRP